MLNKAERLKRSKSVPGAQVDPQQLHRLPPGQTPTDKFPILHEGEVPKYDLPAWRLDVFGEVGSARSFQFGELFAIPTVKVRCDIHCVTRWSKFDKGRNSIQWEGILFRDFLEVIRVKPEAKYVMFHADPDYETNVPLADLLRDDVLQRRAVDGQARLAAAHRRVAPVFLERGRASRRPRRRHCGAGRLCRRRSYGNVRSAHGRCRTGGRAGD